WNEAGEPILRLGDRVDPLIPEAVVERQCLAEAPLVLTVRARAPHTDVAPEVAETLVERDRCAEQQVGNRVVRRKRGGEHAERERGGRWVIQGLIEQRPMWKIAAVELVEQRAREDVIVGHGR